jgi:uncharacterized membrane protein YfcA
MTAPTRVAADSGAEVTTPSTKSAGSWLDRLSAQTGMSPRTLVAGAVLPLISFIAIVATVGVAPGPEKTTIIIASLIGLAAGLSSTAVGVYGGVLVPGLLLMGMDARFVAALSLFLQVLVIPVAAGSHIRLGNFSRPLVVPLLIGGVIGAFIAPFVASAIPKDVIARLVAAMIIIVGAVVFATFRFRGLGTMRDENDTPRARVGGIGLLAGFASGIAGAGWGPVGMTMLILSRIDPKRAIGSSLLARVFMAASAVVGYLIAASAFQNIVPDWWIVVPLFFASVAMMIPGAMLLSRLGRERATILITTLSVTLAIPTLIWGH